jgi:hypothetical protein
MENNRVSRAIISAGCFLAASICISVAYLVPATLLGGKNFARPEEGFELFSPLSRGLFVISCLLFLVAVALAVWALLPPRRPAA